MENVEVQKFTNENGIVFCTVKIRGLVGHCMEDELPVFIERLRKVADEKVEQIVAKLVADPNVSIEKLQRGVDGSKQIEGEDSYAAKVIQAIIDGKKALAERKE